MIAYDMTPRPANWRDRCQWASRRDRELKEARIYEQDRRIADLGRDARLSKSNFGKRRAGLSGNFPEC
jgi:hypothetical protein